MMKCPKCSSVSASEVECSSCGLLFSKWKTIEERERLEAAAALALRETRSATSFNPWIGRGIALFLVVAWTVGLALVYHRHNATRPRPLPPPVEDPIIEDAPAAPAAEGGAVQWPTPSAPVAPEAPPWRAPASSERPPLPPPLPPSR